MIGGERNWVRGEKSFTIENQPVSCRKILEICILFIRSSDSRLIARNQWS